MTSRLLIAQHRPIRNTSRTSPPGVCWSRTLLSSRRNCCKRRGISTEWRNRQNGREVNGTRELMFKYVWRSKVGADVQSHQPPMPKLCCLHHFFISQRPHSHPIAQSKPMLAIAALVSNLLIRLHFVSIASTLQEAVKTRRQPLPFLNLRCPL
jgi:hypothetical protein